MGSRRGTGLRAIAGLLATLCVGLVPTLVVAAAPSGAAVPALHAGGSVDEAWLTGATAGARVVLHRNGATVTVAGNPGRADPLGSRILRGLTPGTGYSWDEVGTGRTSRTFAVLKPGSDPPTGSALYTGQDMHEGLNYLTMRDGIKLAATVRYPSGSRAPRPRRAPR